MGSSGCLGASHGGPWPPWWGPNGSRMVLGVPEGSPEGSRGIPWGDLEVREISQVAWGASWETRGVPGCARYLYLWSISRQSLGESVGS